MNEKIAIITGASRGVGRELAIHLAKSKYTVILLARDEQALKEIHQKILDNGEKSAFLSVDVSDSSQVKKCINEIISVYGRIDVLLNNAAILTRGTVDISDEDIEELIKINLNGAIYVAKYVAAQMRKQRDGYIINMGSLGGKVAASFAGLYAASKFGLSGYSEALSKEMSLYSVKVTNICPSMIASDMAKGRKFLPSQMIQPEDIIKTVDYLLSLSKNAIPTEILISCLPLIEKTTEAIHKLYLS